LVTGGAGFIGSHIVEDLLVKGFEVRIVDNLSKGNIRKLDKGLTEKLQFRKLDLVKDDLNQCLMDVKVVYHLAANPEVNFEITHPENQYNNNLLATQRLLEEIRKKGNIETFVFTSSSTVYGEPTIIPTAENYAPLKPISLYAATKLASEALVSAYANLYGFKAVIYRMANIVGSRSNRGVIYDFISKLKNNPERLVILGDGTQSKSYLHVSDCITGFMKGVREACALVEVYNIGSPDQLNVLTIAEIVKKAMNLKEAKIITTPGIDGGRGWKGDVKTMQLDSSKLISKGWSPRMNSLEAVKKTVKELLMNTQSFQKQC
jgi:UDP-glucose 4-epimerase